MRVDKLTLKEKVGQTLMFGFTGYEVNDFVKEMIREYKLGNIILFARNIKNIEQLHKLTQDLQKYALQEIGIPLYISIDQEGGMVTRIFNGATFFPGNMTLCATNKEEYAYEMGQIMSTELRALGLNMNLAPVLDVNNNPKNPVIGVRSYSDDQLTVAKFGCNFIKGLQENNVVATAKHFPGHGDTATDSHLERAVVPHDMKRLSEVELYPFKKAIESKVDAIMTAHLSFNAIDKDLPATLSKKVLTGLLREKLGYQGLIVTDSMEMKAIKKYYGSEIGSLMAVKAGANIICTSSLYKELTGAHKLMLDAVISGEIEEDYLNQSVEKILEYKEKIIDDVNNLVTNKFSDIVNDVDNAEHKAFAQKVTDEGFTLVKGVKFEPIGTTLIVASEPRVTSNADDSVERKTIKSAIDESNLDMDSMKISIKPTIEELTEIVNKAKNYDNVVVATYNANIYRDQVVLVNKLLVDHSDLHMIMMRNPYDMYELTDVKNITCAYEYTPNSINTVIKYLRGDLIPHGILPIKSN